MRHLDLSALNARLQDIASSSASYVLISIRNGAGRFFDLLTGVILTVYFMLEGEHAYAWFLSFFPQEQRARLDRALTRAELRMGKWLLGQASLMLTLGLVSTIAFLALKVRYAYALGVLMGAFNLIPIMGALISVSLGAAGRGHRFLGTRARRTHRLSHLRPVRKLRAYPAHHATKRRTLRSGGPDRPDARRLDRRSRRRAGLCPHRSPGG